MDSRCPRCKSDLGRRLLRTRPVDGGPLGMKMPIPECP